jgi:hypothetical protein
MSNLKNIQRKISEGISGWLLFEFNCERGLIFNEKYLAYPVGQILNSITEYKTRTEINHPCANEGKGRRLQVDFVLMDNNKDWKFAFESKWIGNTSISLASIIWDLIRLQNLFNHHQTLRSYFILAGFEKKLKLLLSTYNITLSPTSQNIASITKVNPTFLTFDLFKLDQHTKDRINDLADKYPNMALHSKIRCRPAHKFPKKDIVNMSFSTYIFEIMKLRRLTGLKILMAAKLEGQA